MAKKINTEIKWSLKELKELVKDKNSCVYFQHSRRHFGLHPFHLNDLNKGLQEVLSARINYYDHELKGLVLAYKNPKLVSPLGGVFHDSYFVHVDIEAEFYVFKPKIGSTLKGIINSEGDCHFGALVHKTFNVSIFRGNDDEEKLGSNLSVGDEVTFRVRQIDFKGRLPFIRGALLEENELLEDNSSDDDNIKEMNDSEEMEDSSEEMDDSKHMDDNIKKMNDDGEQMEYSSDETNNKPEITVSKKIKKGSSILKSPKGKNYQNIDIYNDDSDDEKLIINSEESKIKKKNKNDRHSIENKKSCLVPSASTENNKLKVDKDVTIKSEKAKMKKKEKSERHSIENTNESIEPLEDTQNNQLSKTNNAKNIQEVRNKEVIVKSEQAKTKKKDKTDRNSIGKTNGFIDPLEDAPNDKHAILNDTNITQQAKDKEVIVKSEQTKAKKKDKKDRHLIEKTNGLMDSPEDAENNELIKTNNAKITQQVRNKEIRIKNEQTKTKKKDKKDRHSIENDNVSRELSDNTEDSKLIVAQNAQITQKVKDKEIIVKSEQTKTKKKDKSERHSNENVNESMESPENTLTTKPKITKDTKITEQGPDKEVTVKSENTKTKKKDKKDRHSVENGNRTIEHAEDTQINKLTITGDTKIIEQGKVVTVKSEQTKTKKKDHSIEKSNSSIELSENTQDDKHLIKKVTKIPEQVEHEEIKIKSEKTKSKKSSENERDTIKISNVSMEPPANTRINKLTITKDTKITQQVRIKQEPDASDVESSSQKQSQLKRKFSELNDSGELRIKQEPSEKSQKKIKAIKSEPNSSQDSGSPKKKFKAMFTE